MNPLNANLQGHVAAAGARAWRDLAAVCTDIAATFATAFGTMTSAPLAMAATTGSKRPARLLGGLPT